MQNNTIEIWSSRSVTDGITIFLYIVGSIFIGAILMPAINEGCSKWWLLLPVLIIYRAGVVSKNSRACMKIQETKILFKVGGKSAGPEKNWSPLSAEKVILTKGNNLTIYDNDGKWGKTIKLNPFSHEDIQTLINILPSKGIFVKIDAEMGKKYFAPENQEKQIRKYHQEEQKKEEEEQRKKEAERKRKHQEELRARRERRNNRHSNTTSSDSIEGIISQPTGRRRVIENEEEVKPHRQIELDDIPEQTPKRKRKLEL